MGKTRDLFKKIRDTKGTFHAKMGSIKDRNGMDRLTTFMHFAHPTPTSDNHQSVLCIYEFGLLDFSKKQK